MLVNGVVEEACTIFLAAIQADHLGTCLEKDQLLQDPEKTGYNGKLKRGTFSK